MERADLFHMSDQYQFKTRPLVKGTPYAISNICNMTFRERKTRLYNMIYEKQKQFIMAIKIQRRVLSAA